MDVLFGYTLNLEDNNYDGSSSFLKRVKYALKIMEQEDIKFYTLEDNTFSITKSFGHYFLLIEDGKLYNQLDIETGRCLARRNFYTFDDAGSPIKKKK